MARWDGSRFVEIAVGFVDGPRAIVRDGDRVLAVGSVDDGPIVLIMTPAAWTSLHVASWRGGTRATWGVTCALADAISAELGGSFDR